MHQSKMHQSKPIKKSAIILIMASNKLYLSIFIIAVLGIIIYFYYNYKGNPSVTEDNKVGLQTNLNTQLPPTQLSPTQLSPTHNSGQTAVKKKYINVDELIASIKSSDSDTSVSSPLLSPHSASDILSQYDRENDRQYESKHNISRLSDNLNGSDTDIAWDACFGLPLMSKKDRDDFAKKMRKENDDYSKSLGKFSKYQTDDSMLIKTDITIDPFNPKQNRQLQNKTIKDIYDEQVAGPKCVSKSIKRKTNEMTIYDDESELNGGCIKGCSLYGFDGVTDAFKGANFGDDF